MQLIRSLGIIKGYNCAIRRKLYELIYSKMFFEGMKRFFSDEFVSKMRYYNEYLLYVYFHVVKTFLGDAAFSKFLNEFDMQYSDKNVKDIYMLKRRIFYCVYGIKQTCFKYKRKQY